MDSDIKTGLALIGTIFGIAAVQGVYKGIREGTRELEREQKILASRQRASHIRQEQVMKARIDRNWPPRRPAR